MPLSGPSAAQTATSGQETSLASQLNANYAQNFGASSAITGNITNELTPILEAGPDQEGFNAAEKSALNSNAISTNATNYKNAAVVAGENEAGAGGSAYAPTGGEGEVQAQIASNAAGNLSQTENQIEQADYAQGRANFGAAESGLDTVAGLLNPNATAQTATGANSAAFNEENQMQQESNAWEGDVAGLVGGLGGAVLSNKGLFNGGGGN